MALYDPVSEQSNHELFDECSQYDYLRITFSDIHGGCRSKIIPTESVKRVLKSEGFGICTITPYLSFDGSFPPNCPYGDEGFPDIFVVPESGTFHPAPWGDREDLKVAQVLGSSRAKSDGSYMETDTRHIAQKLCQQLKSEFDLEIYSAFEMEFAVMDSEGNFPWIGTDMYSNLSNHQIMPTLHKLVKAMNTSGYPIRTINTEYGNGQMELTLFPEVGVKSADAAFIYRSAAKEVFLKDGWSVTFMGKPSSQRGTGTNSGHFNFSLLRSDGKNAFWQDKDTLSPTAQSFMAGVLEHAHGLQALGNPTVNCMRRNHPPTFAPTMVGWAREARDSLIRVKMDGPNSTYFEYRNPSGGCNPYLVLAGILAAGMDGLRKKARLPAPLDREKAEKMSTDLGESIGKLESDTVLVEALGSKLLENFRIVKQLEINKFGSRDEVTEEERKFYSKLV